MSITIRSLLLATLLVLAGPQFASAVDRDSCLEACHDTAKECEETRCGTDEPPVDTDCARLCGERYKTCKDRCPE